MSGARHTPTPWTMDTYGNIIGPDGRVVPMKGVALTRGDEAEANAQLFLAAPAMLAALRNAEKELVGLYKAIAPTGDFASRSEGVAEIRAAIAKAEGSAS